MTNKIKIKQQKLWQIHEKQKHDPRDKFTVEKFLTGGRYFYTFKEAQDYKKKLQKMASSFLFKVVRIK